MNHPSESLSLSCPAASLVSAGSLSLRERQRQAREDAILEAAQSLIHSIGYEVMTMDGLAERVGISKPTLYSFFPSKEAIAVRALTRRMENTIAFLAELPGNLPAVERLQRMVGWVLERKYAQGAQPFPSSPALTVMKQNAEVRTAYERLVAAAARLVEEAKAAGDIDARLHTRVAVQMVFSLVRDPEYEDLLQSGEVTPQSLTQTLMTIYFGGVCHSAQCRAQTENNSSDN